MTAIRYIFFDIDGTLLDAGRAGAHAFETAWTRTFGSPDRPPSLRFHGATDRGLLAQLFAEAGIEETPTRRDRFFEAYEGLLSKELEATDGLPLPGVSDWIARLQDGQRDWNLALLTGNCHRGATLKLRHFGLDDHFHWGAFGCEDPDRNRLAQLARERASQRAAREVAGAEVLVIGDTLRDVQCAQSIGARCLAVATGGASLQELTAAGADWVANTLPEAPFETIFEP